MNAKLFENMTRFGIGIDPWFWERNTADTPNFPPHQIEQLDEDRYRLTLAVAGFSPNEMEITVEHDLLTVKGAKLKTESEHKLLYSGIAFRDWSRQFKIGDHVRVENASMTHGLLCIDLVRELPEAQKVKMIEIH